MDWNPPDTWARLRGFFEGLPAMLPARPRALLVISAHWETPRFTVQRHAAPPLLFDYYGFPPHTYELTWPAPGEPDLADEVARRLSAADLPCGFDMRRGFDHGVFVPLLLAYPEAEIPCVQLSVRADLDPQAHLVAGQALAPLRDEGVLIIGSGNTYHNMKVMMQAMSGQTMPMQGLDFDHWLSEADTHPDVPARDRRLCGWDRAPSAREAAPREEHLIPLHVVAGAAGADRGVKVFEDRILGAVQSAFRFG